MKRDDDYQVRRQSVANLSDKELEQRFWQLAEQIVDPLLKLGYENTSPAIERSVLLRMGFSSIEAKAIADGCVEHNLLGHGAGNHGFLTLSVAESGHERMALVRQTDCLDRLRHRPAVGIAKSPENS